MVGIDRVSAQSAGGGVSSQDDTGRTFHHEAPESRAELEEIPKRVKHPLFVNMLTGGVTPILSVKELEQLGYKIVVCPIESLMVCARAMRDLCEAWKNTGRVDKLATQAVSFAEVKKLLGVEEFLKLRERL